MSPQHVQLIAAELKVQPLQVARTAALLKEGSTVPFIARYRKEATGSLDEVAVTQVRDRIEQLEHLDERRENILTSLEARELLTDELRDRVNGALTITELEDIYLPYRPKRKTRASVAREKGLEPLALQLLEQENVPPRRLALPFVDADKGVADESEALDGARDIIAELVSETVEARNAMRELFASSALVTSTLKENAVDEGKKFLDYYEFQELARTLPSHRVLALFRGEREEILRLTLAPQEALALSTLERQFLTSRNECSDQVRLAVADSYKRLLGPSIETEHRKQLKEQADIEAIRVFADNAKALLLAPPLGQKRMLAIDPGYRTGCKTVVLDRQGNLLFNTAIFPLTGDRQRQESEVIVRKLVEHYQIEAIAVGNGTGGRETEEFLRELELPESVIITLVNESGASIYSASEVARQEFPDHDITVRGAVSIGRRLMDPLAELVKIDPKSIGVGQYQHDVDQRLLKKALDDTVVSCVNAVGVEVNTASPHLLAYVSGLSTLLAQNIVKFREERGPFRNRKQLLEVPRLGPKAFEQAAGFLRIRESDNPLDTSAVHPESYPIVDSFASDLGCTVSDLMREASLRSKIKLEKYVSEGVGLPTLQDIMNELAKPGRDPRRSFEPVKFQKGITTMENLKPGQVLEGTVTNVTSFGAFVDIGVKQDGLVHISQIADTFVKDPNDFVKVNDRVKVQVLSVDLDRRRISLSMKAVEGNNVGGGTGGGERPERSERPAFNRDRGGERSFDGGERRPRRDFRDGDRGERRPRRDGDEYGNQPFNKLRKSYDRD